MHSMRILIADDHELFRSGIELALARLDENMQVTHASDYNALLSRVRENSRLDLILTDLAMPGRPWEDALREVRQICSDVPLVVLSAVHDREILLKVIEMGASGFIPKTASMQVIVGAVNLVLSGGVYIPPHLLQDSGETEPEGGETPLTPRQQEVLQLLTRGKSNKEIARDLDLTEGTVKLHVTAILKTLGVSNRTGAVVAASRMGLVPLKTLGEDFQDA